MSTTANAFRRNFPEFNDNNVYPDPVVDMWLAFAGELLAPSLNRWGGLTSATYTMGINLMTAHELVLARQAQAAAANGAAPGMQSGPINNKSVDKVSVGYDTAATIEEGAGHWNLTTYGSRFLRLAKMMGAGPIQVGIGGWPFSDPLSSINAWPGPDTTPGQGNFS
jgi:hypothetical protein